MEILCSMSNAVFLESNFVNNYWGPELSSHALGPRPFIYVTSCLIGSWAI